MCYSALVKKSLSKLEKELGKELGKEYYEKLYTTIKTDPRKIKFPGFDDRIFPNYVAIIDRNENNRLIEEPMRYSCYAPSYMSESQIKKLSTFNARLDSLNKRFWSESIGKNHGIIQLKGFYEWVKVSDLLKAGLVSLKEINQYFDTQIEARKKKWVDAGKDESKFKLTKTEQKNPAFRDIIIKFEPTTSEDLIVPVIFNSNHENPDDIRGFAIITTEPTPEIAATGHDRMPILLPANAIDTWLNPEGKSLEEIVEFLKSSTVNFTFTHSIAA